MPAVDDITISAALVAGQVLLLLPAVRAGILRQSDYVCHFFLLFPALRRGLRVPAYRPTGGLLEWLACDNEEISAVQVHEAVRVSACTVLVEEVAILVSGDGAVSPLLVAD